MEANRMLCTLQTLVSCSGELEQNGQPEHAATIEQIVLSIAKEMSIPDECRVRRMLGDKPRTGEAERQFRKTEAQAIAAMINR